MGRIGKPQKSRKHKKVRPLDPETALSQDGTQSTHRVRQFQTNQKPRSMEQEIPKKALLLMASMKGQGQLPVHQQYSGVKKKRMKKKFKSWGEGAGANIHTERRDDKSPKHKRGGQDNTHVKGLSTEVLQSAELIERFKLDRDGNIDITKSKRAQKTKRRLKEHKQKEKEKRHEKTKEKDRDFNQFRDEVKFGEVVHAPPVLSSLPRKANSEQGVPRPGKKSLLLKAIITTNSSHNQGLASAGSGGRRQLGQTVKRKHLSIAKQHALDTERHRAIDIYRQMKNKKMKLFS